MPFVGQPCHKKQLIIQFMHQLILSLTRHVICGNNLDWLLNLNLIFETLRTGVRSGLLITMLGKLSWFRLIGLITMDLLI